MIRARTSLLGATLAVALPISYAQAHHSFAMFDRERVTTVDATVKQIEWKNPHIWIWISAQQEGGSTALWGLESGGPAQLNRMGITRNTFKPGEKVRISFHPLRDGRGGGEFAKAEFQDGQVIDMDQAGRKFATGN